MCCAWLLIMSFQGDLFDIPVTRQFAQGSFSQTVPIQMNFFPLGILFPRQFLLDIFPMQFHSGQFQIFCWRKLCEGYVIHGWDLSWGRGILPGVSFRETDISYLFLLR